MELNVDIYHDWRIKLKIGETELPIKAVGLFV